MFWRKLAVVTLCASVLMGCRNESDDFDGEVVDEIEAESLESYILDEYGQKEDTVAIFYIEHDEVISDDDTSIVINNSAEDPDTYGYLSYPITIRSYYASDEDSFNLDNPTAEESYDYLTAIPSFESLPEDFGSIYYIDGEFTFDLETLNSHYDYGEIMYFDYDLDNTVNIKYVPYESIHHEGLRVDMEQLVNSDPDNHTYTEEIVRMNDDLYVRYTYEEYEVFDNEGLVE